MLGDNGVHGKARVARESLRRPEQPRLQAGWALEVLADGAVVAVEAVEGGVGQPRAPERGTCRTVEAVTICSRGCNHMQ